MTRNYISIILAGLLLTALWGCGSSNSGAPAFQGGTHPAGWSAGTYHGVVSLDVAKREQCMECHGKDLRGGISKVSCYACHSTYPHPAGWEDPAQHGPQYKANPQECQKCHGQDLQGGISGVSCSTCHAGFPHPTGWVAPLVHGPQYAANPEGCKICHGPDLRGGTSGVDCVSCHWQDKAKQEVHINDPVTGTSWSFLHGTQAKKAPGGTFTSYYSCQNCHGKDFQGTPVSIDLVTPRSPRYGTQIGCMIAIGCHDMPVGPSLPVAHPPHGGYTWNDVSQQFFASHHDTDVANAPVCLSCHNHVTSHPWYDPFYPTFVTYGNLLGWTAPGPSGCYDATMCHGSTPLPRPLPP